MREEASPSLPPSLFCLVTQRFPRHDTKTIARETPPLQVRLNCGLCNTQSNRLLALVTLPENPCIASQHVRLADDSFTGPSCSKVGLRYPPDKSLSNGISVRETNCAIQWIVIYPVDSVIHLLNNWGQVCCSPLKLFYCR